MSYMDRVGGQLPRAGAPPETSPPPPPTTTSPRRPGSSNLPRAPSASSRVAASRSTAAPPTQPSLNFTVRREQVDLPIHTHPHSSGDPSHESVARLMTAFSLPQDRAAVQDTHIHHLRHQIESRLKVGARTGRLATQNYCYMQVSLGEDLAASLTDGVVLCHIANHCSPRSVSSIHVPSPAVVSLLLSFLFFSISDFLFSAEAVCGKVSAERGQLFGGVQENRSSRGQ